MIVYFHGGGWAEGSPSQIDYDDDETPAYNERIGGAILELVNSDESAAEEGWVVVSASYRLTKAVPDDPDNPEPTPKENRFPAQVIDAKAAVNCAKQLPDIDPDHVVVSGSSAGGYLAAMVALTQGLYEPTVSSKPDPGLAGEAPPGGTVVRSAVNLDGPTDLEALLPFDEVAGQKIDTELLVEHLLCGGPLLLAQCDLDSLLKDASPLTYADRYLGTTGPAPAPMYLACGDTPVFGEAFTDCNSHRAFYLAAGFGDSNGDGVLDDHADDRDGNDALYLDITDRSHLRIDRFVNYSILKLFIDL